ncbi:hypothetical protein [Hyalangium rubrum]|uniref:Uncharacterized protein n=1 Tax=Hyalangium rubrum TaxID=3103134 RepID=A0ABU5GX59_9BACT|nr:hypothetical protein [Hyalangium sp. s54d21]MDY7225284.1 hypothetical protein [Hyalangium sp. s54d21]
MPSSLEPRPLFDALRSGAPLPNLAPDAVEQARTLAKDPAAAPSASVEALPPALAEAILEGAVLAGSTALPEALSRSNVKALAKSAKKALYRLRSKGIAVAEAPRPAAEPARTPEPEALSALVTTITTDGRRALVLGRSLREGIESVQAVLSDELGVMQLSLTEVKRGSYRQRIKDSKGLAVELSREEGAALLAEAAALNLRSRTPFPKDLDTALRHHGVQPATSEPTLPPPEPDDVRGVLEGHTLHQTVEISEWLPPEPELRKVTQKVEEVVHSPLSLSEAQREEQLLQAMRSLARAFFTPEVRKRYGLRLWRMADFFERSGRASAAQVARAEARRLFHGPVEPFSRFAEFLFEKALLLIGPRATAPGTPQQASRPAAPEPAAPSERRSPGGLIIP